MRWLSLVFLMITGFAASAATCTIAVTSNWNTCVCQETGAAPVSGDAIVVNAGVTLTFTTNPNFTGTLTINGTVVNSFANAKWNGNITIGGTGTLRLDQKMDIGTSSGCGYTLVVNSGGQLDLNASGGSDLLSICGQKIAQSGGGCGTYPTGPLPYCEPTGGFDGPFTFNQSGLPITLLYFRASIPQKENYALLEWATDKEESFSHFEVQRAGSDLKFATIQEIPGAGYNTESVKTYNAKDENPLVGTGYYRLKAVDIDGSHEYFQVRSVNYSGGRKIVVSPNPVSGTSFKFSINFDPGSYDRVSLIDPLGNEVYNSIVNSTSNEVKLNGSVRSGVYLLRYSSANFQEVARIFVNN